MYVLKQNVDLRCSEALNISTTCGRSRFSNHIIWRYYMQKLA